MPINPRGSGFEATVHNKGQRYRKTFTTRVQAEAWELQLKADLKSGKSINEGTAGVNSSSVRNLQELLDLTHRKYWIGKSSEKSALLNAQKCVDTLGKELHPSMVDETAIDNMIFLFEAEGIAPATINRRLSAISKMLTFAYERQHITRKPKIDRQTEPKHRVRFISLAEEAEMLAYYRHIGNEDMRDLIIVGIDTGQRLNEIRRLKGEWIFPDGNQFNAQSKGGAIRTIPMTVRVREILLRRLEMVEGNQRTPLWEGWTNGKIRHLWNHGKSHLGLMSDSQFVPHVMRHTFCSRLVQRGVDIVSVSQLAGHASITMTMRYSHLCPANLTNAIKALEPQEVAA